MKQILFLLSISLITVLSSCMKGESVDLIIHNARVHTMDDDLTIEDAVAIRNGKIVEVGPERQILNKYSADKYIDVQKKDVYPGWVDAHGHMMSYARMKLSVDLVGCKSFDELLLRIERYQSRYKRPFIIGRGWDQSLWGDEMPTNEKLSELYPDLPVCLFRIDGHALLANDYLIKEADAFNKYHDAPELFNGGHYEGTIGAAIPTEESVKLPHISGNDGHIGLVEGRGVFVDNAMNPILDILPDFPKKELVGALMEVQDELLMYGITGVHEAGVTRKELAILEGLVNNKKLKLNLYAMLLPTEKNFAFARNKGVYRNKNLYVRSFKVYGDGALGSRGAFLKHPYHDRPNHQGYLTTSRERMRSIFQECLATGYQMNTHAIGDSTNRIILDMYREVYDYNPDHRWRVEHAQIVDPSDFSIFSEAGVFPSVQPTHATSDQGWAESRIGSEHMDGAYSYKSILDSYGKVAIGTDFPVELTDPFRTIHAAVNRKNADNFPSSGFRADEAISLDECILGMTKWAAFAAFQEKHLGTIEKGKDATLSIFEKPVRANESYKPNFAFLVYIKGEQVYSTE